MEYYVMRVKYLKDGTVKKSEVMSYATKQEALAKYHTNMGTDMVDDTLKGSMCTVINGMGGQEIADYWSEPEPEPTPEPNEGDE